ncbi:MAG: hypothetical protein H7Z13_06890 [Ferruginibacter sp.]|nr:hypothetical protein [Ferruginibacter sp.]
MLLFEVGFVELEGMAIVIISGLVFYLMTELRLLRKEIRAKQPPTTGNSLLPLQAYERLTLLADRIALKNLVTRMHSTVLSATELQAGLVETIRNEYEHNITQQMYINPEVWKAVTNMKEQNIFIINQLAEALPPKANAMELSKLILEYVGNNNAELSPIVLDAIQYEVKKLI